MVAEGADFGTVNENIVVVGAHDTHSSQGGVVGGRSDYVALMQEIEVTKLPINL